MNASFLLLSAAVTLGADTPAPVVTAPPPVVAGPVVTAPLTGTVVGGCGAPAVAAWSTPVSACDPCAPRVGLFDKLKAKWASRPRLFGNSCGCAAAPACAPAPVVACAPAPVVACAPAPMVAAPAACGCGQPLFTGFTTSCHDPCERVGLLARLRARFASSKSCDAVAAPLAAASCGSSIATTPVAGCATSFGTVLTPPPAGVPVMTPPVKMPAPMPPADPKKDEPKKDEPKKDEPKKESSIQLPSLAVPVVEAPRVPTLGGTSGKY